MKCIGVITSGGDAPGMNAAIRSVTRTALKMKLKVKGVRRGYAGLIEGDFIELSSTSVSGIINRGGTILHTVRCPQFKKKHLQKKAALQLKKANIEGLVVIGGNGSIQGAASLQPLAEIPIAGIPATIDNDVPGTDVTIGFDTAVNTALDAIDKIRDTAFSHERVFVVEVMGRKRGFLALEVAVAGGASHVLLPEIPYTMEEVSSKILEDHKRGKDSIIVVVAEGAGRAIDIGEAIQRNTALETRITVLGHLLRGGNPSAESRFLGSVLGYQAIKALKKSKGCFIVGTRSRKVVTYPARQVLKKKKRISHAMYALVEKITL